MKSPTCARGMGGAFSKRQRDEARRKPTPRACEGIVADILSRIFYCGAFSSSKRFMLISICKPKQNEDEHTVPTKLAFNIVLIKSFIKCRH